MLSSSSSPQTHLPHPAPCRGRRPRRRLRPAGRGRPVGRRERGPPETLPRQDQPLVPSPSSSHLRNARSDTRRGRRQGGHRQGPGPRGQGQARRPATSSRTRTARSTPATSARTRTPGPRGDLVVDTTKTGKTEQVIKATPATLKVASLTPAIAASKAEKTVRCQGRRFEENGRRPGAPQAIWAANGTPTLAYETVVGELPGRRHPERAARHHRRGHRQEALRVPGHRDRHRQHPVQRPGDADDHAVGLQLHTHRRRARRPQDVQPQPRYVRHRHPVLADQRHLGQRHHVERRDRARRPLRRRRDVGLLQEHLRPQHQ